MPSKKYERKKEPVNPELTPREKLLQREQNRVIEAQQFELQKEAVRARYAWSVEFDRKEREAKKRKRKERGLATILLSQAINLWKSGGRLAW